MQEAPMRGLLAMEQREVVADVVNTCMLSAIHGLRKWDPRPQVLTGCLRSGRLTGMQS